MKKRFAAAAIFAALALFGAGCAGSPAVHTYWLKNSSSGTYSRHDSYTELSTEEIKALGLTAELPAGAKTTD